MQHCHCIESPYLIPAWIAPTVFPISKSSNLPGVPITMLAPSSSKFWTSLSTLFPPIKSCWVRSPSMSFKNSAKTSLIWDANSRVGLIIKVPISCFLRGVESFDKISKIGMMNARVLPLPLNRVDHEIFLDTFLKVDHVDTTSLGERQGSEH